ncbi:MAG: excinuclease ABC subunit UvrA, partial [Symbiobacteriaceae bacterium]|nr:excinuclease ABC subunit UvrA [Symbiobacteriaceae bacterium]
SSAECREETEKIDGEFLVYMYCSSCGQRMTKLTRTHFSYNTREGACPTCSGLGKEMVLNIARAVDETLSIEEGALRIWDAAFREYYGRSYYAALEYYGLGKVEGLPVNSFNQLQKELLYEGVESPQIAAAFPQLKLPKTITGGRFEGVAPLLRRRSTDQGGLPQRLEAFFDARPCQECQGERLSTLSRQVTVAGTRLPELSSLSLIDLADWVNGLEQLSQREQALVAPYLLDLQTKIERLQAVGLSYLTLDRQAITLSGGEAQRIKLAALLASEMTGLIFILDEPTVGLHPRDTEGMISILQRLRDKGNTVIVIEHDPQIMQAADHIVDIGPGAGKRGGEIVGEGSYEELLQQESSVTGAWLKLPKPALSEPRRVSQSSISIRDASLYNLRHIDVDFPLGTLTAVAGVSGSGKSTLVFETLALPGSEITGLEKFNEVITIEQAAVTRMKRSNVATYCDIYGEIRKIFGALPEAGAQGLSAKHFSFNSPGGRCEHCEGLGVVTSNMMFFTDIEVTCPECGGKQFNEQVLGVKYQGLSIKEVLQLSVEEARELFAGQRKITRVLDLLQDVGLAYLELGQTMTTLSGGEGQRLKLATELLKAKGKSNLYLMDEPTTGLHPVDTEGFLKLLHRIVDEGNTVIVVEHNTQVIRACDWVIELGPGGGSEGGEVIFAGPPVLMQEAKRSVTAPYL